MRRARIAYAIRWTGGIAGLASLLMAWPALSASPRHVSGSESRAEPGTGPELKLSAANPVPACFTAERLMQHVARANPSLDPKFGEIAGLYAAQGEKLAIRWDYAFFQMLVETNNLTFSGPTVRAELSKDHNNFANISAADDDEPDRFADVATGVAAHLHHIRLYAGDPVAKPAAKRTKKVESFILPWSRQLKRPVRFDDMTSRWSPKNPAYGSTIEAAISAFRNENCGPDTARTAAAKTAAAKIAAAETETAGEEPRTGRKEERRRKHDRTQETAQTAPVRSEPVAARSDEAMPSSAESGLGEPIRVAKAQATAPAAARVSTAAVAPSVTAAPSVAGPAATRPAATLLAAATPPPRQDPPETATSGVSAGPGASGAAPTASAGAHCKVWSASFGGDKSVLIRVSDGLTTHFTALQVNAGREKEETTAYISAYARGGASVGEFSTADQAINKAFELCPKI